MFGLPSFPKLFVLFAVITIVWYGFKYLQSSNRRPKDNIRNPSDSPNPKNSTTDNHNIDLVYCEKCDKYLTKAEFDAMCKHCKD